jgi:uncharacterized protein YndB with AHSA1/START domain
MACRPTRCPQPQPAATVTSRRGSVRHQVRLACDPDRVWELVGDPTRLAEWFPGVESCTVEGDQRVIVTRSGLPMPETILTVDASQRRFQYRVTAPLFKEHLGTVDVLDLDDGTCLAVYSTDAEPAALALVVGGAARAGLANVAECLSVAVVTGSTPPVPPSKGVR